MNNTSPDRLRGISEAAEYHGIARSTLNDLVRAGQIAYVRVSQRGERRIPDSAVRAWIARNLVSNGAK